MAKSRQQIERQVRQDNPDASDEDVRKKVDEAVAQASTDGDLTE